MAIAAAHRAIATGLPSGRTVRYSHKTTTQTKNACQMPQDTPAQKSVGGQKKMNALDGPGRIQCVILFAQILVFTAVASYLGDLLLHIRRVACHIIAIRKEYVEGILAA